MIWLILAYPLLTHAAVWLHEPRLQWLSLTVLATISMYDALKHRRRWAWITLIALAAAFWELVHLGGGTYALYLPPIVLPASLGILFARSLRPGSIPLITRFAAALRGPMPPDLAAYTDRVTYVWTFAFAALTLSAVALAVFATPALWSVMTNFLHYLFMGALFLVEYIYRRYRFRHLEHPNFFAYVRSLFTIRVQSL